MASKATAPAKPLAEEEQVIETVDPRAAALAALTGGAVETPVEAESVAEIRTDDAEDFGGDRFALVLSSRYNGKTADGAFKFARKGTVIKTTPAAVKRGVAIGALRAVDGK